MHIIQRLRDLLAKSGKVRGHKVPVYGQGGRFDHNAVQHVEIEVGDFVELCNLLPPDHEVIRSTKAVRMLAKNRKIVLHADRLFHILDEAEKASTAAAAPVAG